MLNRSQKWLINDIQSSDKSKLLNDSKINVYCYVFFLVGFSKYDDHRISTSDSEENQKTQPGFKPRFSSIWWVGFLIFNNQ